MSFERSAQIALGAQVYARWYMITQWCSALVPALLMVPLYSYFSFGWAILVAGLFMTTAALFTFLVLPDLVGTAMSNRVKWK